MKTMLPPQIEAAALRAWPAPEQIHHDGWLLRFAHGYTKRSNSVTPLHSGQIDLLHKIAHCEQIYADHGLPCIFRIPSFAAPALDDRLAQRGYTLLDPTLVLHRDLFTPVPSTDLRLRLDRLDRWLATFCDLSQTSLPQHRTHRAIIKQIAGRRLLATLVNGDVPVACGMGVADGTLFGLFDIVTAAHARRRGYGTALVAQMLRWAAQHDAHAAYLQVVATNDAALHMYRKLGFAQAYRYWYRVAPA